jgi:hypothetical protein
MITMGFTIKMMMCGLVAFGGVLYEMLAGNPHLPGSFSSSHI